MTKENSTDSTLSRRNKSVTDYYKRAKEWDKTKFIAETIIPWTSEWLLHYEIWVATGTWHGGGIH